MLLCVSIILSKWSKQQRPGLNFENTFKIPILSWTTLVFDPYLVHVTLYMCNIPYTHYVDNGYNNVDCTIDLNSYVCNFTFPYM